MPKSTLPKVGIAEFPEFSFEKYPKRRGNITRLIEEHYKARGIEETDLTEFFRELERAIKWSLFNQALPNYSRAKIKNEIENLRGAETIEELMQKIPNAVRHWLFTKEMSLHRMKRPRDIQGIIRLLIRRADRELTGKGRDKYPVPVLLAADIAIALKRIGIKPVASRPTDSGKPSVFYQVVQECFAIAGLANKDPYNCMKTALTVNILNHHPQP